MKRSIGVKPSDFCTYEVKPGVECYHGPISADYFESDALRGERVLASLCSIHDRAEARRYALARGYIRRDRRPELRALSEEELLHAYGPEPA